MKIADLTPVQLAAVAAGFKATGKYGYAEACDEAVHLIEFAEAYLSRAERDEATTYTPHSGSGDP